MIALLSVLLLFSCAEKSPEKTGVVEKPATDDSTALIRRGEYLVNAIGCDDCHSPKQMGPHGPEVIADLRFSGYPASRPAQTGGEAALKAGWVLLNGDLTSAVGPWGQSFASNITSDATGIGNWTLENFMTCIREGKSKGMSTGRPLLPPMPWYNFAKLSDEDLKAVFHFLKSTKPVSNVVPAPVPPVMK